MPEPGSDLDPGQDRSGDPGVGPLGKQPPDPAEEGVCRPRSGQPPEAPPVQLQPRADRPLGVPGPLQSGRAQSLREPPDRGSNRNIFR